ncbi:hypothetical protein COO60DRAFT_1475257 [Scenedesmus sp. NREL 46B-D3]|nr:hypothetical protein COO60DRAFT_1475257 [Scenedesmus sp. NREL 46B-D3]
MRGTRLHTTSLSSCTSLWVVTGSIGCGSCSSRGCWVHLGCFVVVQQWGLLLVPCYLFGCSRQAGELVLLAAASMCTEHVYRNRSGDVEQQDGALRILPVVCASCRCWSAAH